jgi:hypothetical protein
MARAEITVHAHVHVDQAAEVLAGILRTWRAGEIHERGVVTGVFPRLAQAIEDAHLALDGAGVTVTTTPARAIEPAQLHPDAIYDGHYPDSP